MTNIEFWPCAVCGVETSRGSLLYSKGEWVAVPLYPPHRNAVAEMVGPDTLVIDSKRPN